MISTSPAGNSIAYSIQYNDQTVLMYGAEAWTVMRRKDGFILEEQK